MNVKPITFEEIHRLYGQDCQVRRIEEYFIENKGWIKSDFTEPVEAQINRVLLMGATIIKLEIHHPIAGRNTYADYRITDLQE